MRDEMARVRESHFTYEGVMRHIWRWLADPWAAELFCYPPVPPDWTLLDDREPAPAAASADARATSRREARQGWHSMTYALR